MSDEQLQTSAEYLIQCGFSFRPEHNGEGKIDEEAINREHEENSRDIPPEWIPFNDYYQRRAAAATDAMLAHPGVGNACCVMIVGPVPFAIFYDALRSDWSIPIRINNPLDEVEAYGNRVCHEFLAWYWSVWESLERVWST